MTEPKWATETFGKIFVKRLKVLSLLKRATKRVAKVIGSKYDREKFQ